MGGTETKGEQVGIPLPVARRAPPGLATKKSGKGRGDGSRERGRDDRDIGEGERYQG